MNPVLGREVVERQQLLDVVGDLGDRLRKLRPVGRPRTPCTASQGVASCPRRSRSRRAPSSRPGAPTSAAQQEHSISCGTSNAARGSRGNTSRSAPQNPSAPSPTASTGARMPRRRQSRSRSAHDSVGLAVTVGQRDQLLAAVGAHPDHHQQAQLGLLQAHVDMDAVGPQVHVVHARQVPLGERLLPRPSRSR